jgi:hypothetical protein
MDTAMILEVSTVLAGRITCGLSIGLALIGVSVLVWRRSSLLGTTMMAPWYWTLLSLLSVAGSETLIGLRAVGNGLWVEPLRLAAATTTFCPMIAALGAKRPQDRAWQFIVLTLWGILARPAVETYILRPAQVPQIHTVQAWFMLILIVAGVANMLPTRFWISALLFAAAQVLLLAGYLPLGVPQLGALGVICALSLGVSAMTLAAAGIPARCGAKRPIDQLWLDFRDTFGVLWGLRVAERINATSAMHGWEIALSWHGFHVPAGDRSLNDFPSHVSPVFCQSLNNLLRRFVSPEWIARRMGEGHESCQPPTQGVNS